MSKSISQIDWLKERQKGIGGPMSLRFLACLLGALLTKFGKRKRRQ
jgi:hypothetical protein